MLQIWLLIFECMKQAKSRVWNFFYWACSDRFSEGFAKTKLKSYILTWICTKKISWFRWKTFSYLPRPHPPRLGCWKTGSGGVVGFPLPWRVGGGGPWGCPALNRCPAGAPRRPFSSPWPLTDPKDHSNGCCCLHHSHLQHRSLQVPSNQTQYPTYTILKKI